MIEREAMNYAKALEKATNGAEQAINWASDTLRILGALAADLRAEKRLTIEEKSLLLMVGKMSRELLEIRTSLLDSECDLHNLAERLG